MHDGLNGEQLQEAAEARREDAEQNVVAAVTREADADELNARLFYVRGQRDALLKACSATRMFHSFGGLITREQVEKWRALTGDADFSAQGLFNFVVRQMAKAGVQP